MLRRVGEEGKVQECTVHSIVHCTLYCNHISCAQMPIESFFDKSFEIE